MPLFGRILVALLLTVAAIASAALGIFVSMISACCGSSDSGSPLPALIGVGIAWCLVSAAVGLFRDWPRRTILTLTGTLPAASVVAAAFSSDLALVAPFVIAGWLTLAALLHEMGEGSGSSPIPRTHPRS